MSKGGGGQQYYPMPTINNSSSNTSQNIPEWLNNASQAGVGYAGNLLANPGIAYSGELSPGLSPFQQEAGNAIQRITPGAYQPFWDKAAGYTNSSTKSAPDIAAQTFANGLSGISKYMNPYVSNVVDAVTAQNKQNLDNSLTQTADQAIASKAFGSSRHGVQEGVATANNNLGLSNVVSNLLSSGYNQATNLLGQDISNDFNAQAANQANANNYYNRMLSAGGQLANIGQAQQASDQTSINNMLQFGNLQQQTQAAQNTAKYNEWLRQQGLPYQALQSYNQTVGTAPHSTSGSSNTTSIGYAPQQQSSSSPISTALGLGLGGLSMLGGGGLSGTIGSLGLGLLGASPLPSSYNNPRGY